MPPHSVSLRPRITALFLRHAVEINPPTACSGPFERAWPPTSLHHADSRSSSSAQDRPPPLRPVSFFSFSEKRCARAGLQPRLRADFLAASAKAVIHAPLLLPAASVALMARTLIITSSTRLISRYDLPGEPAVDLDHAAGRPAPRACGTGASRAIFMPVGRRGCAVTVADHAALVLTARSPAWARRR